MAYLEFISDKNLVSAVTKVIDVIENAEKSADVRLHKNVIDPFSALFHGITHTLSCKEWVEQERARQIQKTMQNAIGKFHQDILGSIDGWTNLEVGGILDVVHKKRKIIAEIKNKFNTTKGNHRVEVYDSIKAVLKKDAYKNYRGYSVEIIPHGKNIYNKPFTPPDNKTGENRPIDEMIRVIDGVSFYGLATGNSLALQELFLVLPQVIADNYSYKLNNPKIIEYFILFTKAFPT